MCLTVSQPYKNVMTPSGADICCPCSEAKYLDRQSLLSTRPMAIKGYTGPEWVVICQKFICLEMEIGNALIY